MKFSGEENKRSVTGSAPIPNLGMSKFNKECKKWELIGRSKHRNIRILGLRLLRLIITGVSSIKFMEKEQHIVSHTFGCRNGRDRQEILVLGL